MLFGRHEVKRCEVVCEGVACIYTSTCLYRRLYRFYVALICGLEKRLVSVTRQVLCIKTRDVHACIVRVLALLTSITSGFCAHASFELRDDALRRVHGLFPHNIPKLELVLLLLYRFLIPRVPAIFTVSPFISAFSCICTAPRGSPSSA